MTRATLLGVSLLAAGLTGCGPPRFTFVPVEGVVTRDGKPAANLLVTYIVDPESDTRGPRAWGITGADGRYQLRADDGTLGSVVGRHRVTISALSPEATRSEPAPDGPPVPAARPAGAGRKAAGVAARYAQVWKTPLRAEVSPDGTVTGADITLPAQPGAE